MTMHITDPSGAQPAGPPPPFDPELAPVVETLTSLRPADAYRPDNIMEMRKSVPGVETPTDDVLAMARTAWRSGWCQGRTGTRISRL